MKRARTGFTLIELMVVVIIIAALAGMVLPHLLDRPDYMKQDIAKGDIANIQTALEQYKLDNNRFPSTPEGLGALITKPASAEKWRGPYLKRKADDPWDRPYQYKCPGEKNPTGPDVWSMGADGKGGNEDDVWPD